MSFLIIILFTDVKSFYVTFVTLVKKLYLDPELYEMNQHS